MTRNTRATYKQILARKVNAFPVSITVWAVPRKIAVALHTKRTV